MPSSDKHDSDKGKEIESFAATDIAENEDAALDKEYTDWIDSKKPSYDIYDTMRDLGSLGATSLQRVYPYPTVDLDQYRLTDLPSEIKLLIGRRDLSSEPLEGDMTDDLFLAHRDEAQLNLMSRRKRRRMLDYMPLLGDELQQELQELHDADDAESETSATEVETVHFIGEDGKESVIDVGLKPVGKVEGSPCTDECILKDWNTVDFGASISSESNSPKMSVQDPIPLYAVLPAKHIRVLELLPGAWDTSISCMLHLQNLDEVPIFGRREEDGQKQLKLPRYEALSYHWGSPVLTDTIMCNESPTKITRNLHSALRHLRETEHSRYLWIDALCIDQTNNLERNDQVRCMLKIYKRAFRVVIWLGESTEDEGERAILFIKVIDHLGHRWTVLHASHEPECIRTLEFGYRAVCKLYRRPWFQRTWIRQELAAGRKVIVQCGRQSISWAALKRGSIRVSSVRKKLQELKIPEIPVETRPRTIEYLKRGWIYGQTAFGNVAVAGSLYYWHGGGLLDLLLSGTHFDVTDPRDRIYAVLGLAREPIADGDNDDALFPYLGPGEVFDPMTVNYNSTISEVYQRLAKMLINRDANLDVLCVLHGLRNEASGDLPSWTPDWRVRWGHGISDYLTLRFFASGYTRAERQDQADLGRLRIKAYIVDRVESVLDITAKAWDLMYENGEAIIKSNGSLENRTQWRGLAVFEPLEAQSDRRCCLTHGGHVALVPLTAKAGDLIYVVLGARLPFILRDASVKREAGATLEALNLDHTDYSEEFRVLGPCCLPGFMQGEVFSLVGDQEALRLTLV